MCTSLPAESDVTQEVQGDTAEQRHSGDGIERIADPRERGLQAESREHDPGDDRVMEYAVGVACQLVLLASGLRLDEPAHGEPRDTSKYSHQSAAAIPSTERRSGHDAEVDELVRSRLRSRRSTRPVR